MSNPFGYFDPTALAAISGASRGLPKKEEPKPRVSNDYIYSMVGSVIRAFNRERAANNPSDFTGEHAIDIAMKHLGTIAASPNMDDTHASTFCRALNNATEGEFNYDNLMQWYRQYKQYIENGGPNSATSFAPPMVSMKIVDYVKKAAAPATTPADAAPAATTPADAAPAAT